MGLDMYLTRLPKVSDKEIKEFNRRLSLASFEGNEKKELKKIEKELGYKLPVRTYNFVDIEKSKETYHELQAIIATSTDEEKVVEAKIDLDDLLTGWGKVSVGDEAMYWRKENAIHAWFVDNVQNGVDDCGGYEVSEQNIKDLVEAIETALKNPDDADEVLPTQSGFFFGGTEYDEWYFKALKETKTKLKRLLSSKAFQSGNYRLEYHASW